MNESLSTKSRLILHGAILLLIVMLFFVSLFGYGAYELHRGKISVLLNNRTIQLYATSGRTVCRDQGNDWKCKPVTIKGNEYFLRQELIQPEVAKP